jgi:hypothetical protein
MAGESLKLLLLSVAGLSVAICLPLFTMTGLHRQAKFLLNTDSSCGLYNLEKKVPLCPVVSLMMEAVCFSELTLDIESVITISRIYHESSIFNCCKKT